MLIELRQGDYLPQVRALFGSAPTGGVSHATDRGVVVISQCCDLAKASANNLPVGAKVVHLEGVAASNARSGRQPQYFQCEHLGDNLFVDFGVTGGVELDPHNFSDRSPETDETRRRALAGRVGRRFARYAYPNGIQPFLNAIQRRFRSKNGKLDSALGRCLEQLRTLRVETEWGKGPPWAITLVFVLADKYLPALNASPVIPHQSLIQSPKGIDDAARAIDACPAKDPKLPDLWQRLGDLVVADAFNLADSAIVSEVIAEITDESDYSYARYIRSVDLDIDDLSEPDEPLAPGN